ncbi:MAG TPA: phosphate ABC transporter permease [Blastocatellia bacterium]|nr:phosphate ABC transporter permease [Blastocatellia bacterium]HAF21396.1 phosphate ABC transporter permease [Blastocatellia bacterium]HCX31879.1 phosphate ABC transporter permease [Blastocatellia bacterium]
MPAKGPSSSARTTLLHRSHPRRVSVLGPPSLSGLNLINDLAKLRQYSDLLLTLSIHRIKVRYKQSVLGVFWAILQPLSMMLIFTFIFSLIAKMPSDGAPYAIFAYTALLPWNYFSTAVSNATNSLVSHSQFVTKVYFPREILPITYVVVALFDFVVASTLLAALMIYYHVSLTVNVLYAVPIILVVSCFALAMSFFFSATQVRFRDIGVAVPLLLQLWLFATPVIYPFSAVPSRWRPFYVLNPMVGVIEGFRQVILRGAAPETSSLLISAVISVILLVASYLYFKRVEATMADFV